MSTPTPTPTTSVHVKLTVDPSKIPDFLAIMRPNFEAVTAEPLNTFFEVYRDDKNPGVFKLVENWDADLEYMMNVQIKKPYYKSYHAALPALLLKEHEVELYSRMPGNEWTRVKVDRYLGRSGEGAVGEGEKRGVDGEGEKTRLEEGTPAVLAS